MNCNVIVREGDPEIPQMGEKHAKGSIKLSPIFGGSHEVDGDGVRGGCLAALKMS